MKIYLIYAHFILVAIILRSGLQLLSGFPRFYWNDHSIQGKEWIRFDRKNSSSKHLHRVEEVAISLPVWMIISKGKKDWRLAFEWHQFAVILFLLNGMSYLLTTSPLSFRDYIWMILGILIALTGITALPNWMGYFPSYLCFFGGRQKARSFYFLAMVGMSILTLSYIPYLFSLLGLLFLGLLLFIHTMITYLSDKQPKKVIKGLQSTIYPIFKILSLPLPSRQRYSPQDISPNFWVKGPQPLVKDWIELSNHGFSHYKLPIFGLVKVPLKLSLEELKNLPKVAQITKHFGNGWTGIAEWEGVEISTLMQICQPLKEARYIIFRSFRKTDKGEDYTSIIDIKDANRPQVILAYKMNGKTLPKEYGAPIRLRVEGRSGNVMVKWLKEIEFVKDL